MALRLIEGFDSFPTVQLSKRYITSESFSTISVVSTKARTGTYSLKFSSTNGVGSSWIAYSLPFAPSSNGIIGFGFLYDETTTGGSLNIAAFHPLLSGGAYLALTLNTDRTFSVYRGTNGAGTNPSGTLLATSAQSITTNVWYYLEWRAVINTTVGQTELRVNGNPTPWINVTSTNTQAVAGNPEIRTFALGAFRDVTLYFDDVYYLDGNSSAGTTTFLGDCKVDTVFPSSDGNQTDFTPSTGVDNYAMVDEVVPDDDTTYNQSSTVNDIDLYGFPDVFGVGVSANVFGVQISNIVRKTETGPAGIAPVIRSNATNYMGANGYPSISYHEQIEIFEKDPATSAAWTTTAINDAEFGLKRIV